MNVFGRLFCLCLFVIAAAPVRAQESSAPSPEAENQALATQTFHRFEAGYFYAAAQWALLHGQTGSAADLIKRAQEIDPSSQLLAKERAELLEHLGRDSELQPQLEARLAKDPKDKESRQRLSGLYQRAGLWDKARALYLGSSELEDLRTLAGLDLMQGKLSDARQRLEKVVELGKDDEDSELLALVLLRLDQTPAAVAALEALVKRSPKRPTAWAQLSACYDADNNTPAAARTLQLGLKALPESSLLMDRQAKLAYRNGDYALAESSFSFLLKQDEKDSRLRLYRGLARMRGKRLPQAEEDFRQLTTQEPDNIAARYALALTLILQQKDKEAGPLLDAVIKERPDSLEAWMLLAYAEDRAKGRPASVQVLERAAKANPKSVEFARLLAAGYMDADRYKEAAALLKEALKNGAEPGLRMELAISYDKLGKFEKAEAELKALIQAQPKEARALNYLGYSWADRGKHLDEAEALIRRALVEEPKNPYYLDSLGWVLFKQGKFKEALQPLLDAAAGPGVGEGSAGEAEVFEHLEQVQAKLGMQKEALASRQRAQDIKAKAPAQPPLKPPMLDPQP